MRCKKNTDSKNSKVFHAKNARIILSLKSKVCNSKNLIFKGGEVYDLGNDCLISVLCCFSKILEKKMYSRIYKHLLNNKILYKKQFGFQEYHSAHDTIIELVDQTSNSFEKNHFTLGVLMDLPKTFNTVDTYIDGFAKDI